MRSILTMLDILCTAIARALMRCADTADAFSERAAPSQSQRVSPQAPAIRRATFVPEESQSVWYDD